MRPDSLFKNNKRIKVGSSKRTWKFLRVGVLVLLGFSLLNSWSRSSAAPAIEQKKAAPPPQKEGKTQQKPKKKLILPLVLGACTSREQWRFGSALPENLQEDLAEPPRNADTAKRTLKAAYAFRSSTQDPGMQALADYLIARSLYELKLVHISYSMFESLVRPSGAPSFAMEAVASAMTCISEIHQTYPTLRGKSSLTPVLLKILEQKITTAQKGQVWRLLASIAGKKISDHSSKTMIQEEMKGLKGSGPYEILLLALNAFKKGAESEALQQSERFLDYRALPADLKDKVNAIHLNLGRLYFNQKNYKKADEHFNKVDTRSNFVPQAVMGSAWTKFINKDYEGAAGKTVSLVYRELRTVYEPHAPLLLAIIQYENCRYQEAFEAIRAFKKKYAPIHSLLYDWHKNKKAQPPVFYDLIVDFFEEKQKLPRNLISQWLRSPVFIGLQQELNLLIAESDQMKQLEEEFRSQSGDTAFSAPLVSYLLKIFQRFEGQHESWEKAIIQKINHEILWTNYFMIPPLLDAFDNAQLVEAEVLRELGTSVLSKDRATLIENAKENKKSSSKGDTGLNWGKVETSDDADEEVWADEVGSVQANFSSLCKKK